MNTVAEKAVAAPVTITLPELNEGEKYAGIVLKDGVPSHHLILLPGDKDDGNWPDAIEWAKERGGELPTKQEQSILYGNLPDEFQKDWYWSGTEFSSDDAWCLHFYDGFQNFCDKDTGIRARAVRRLVIQ